MKVLFFTKYTRTGASSRLRSFQYFDFLRTNGVECVVSPLFCDDYLEQVYKKKTHNKWLALKGFIRRLGMLLFISRYDRIVIEKELFPYFPAIFEFFLGRIGIRYIVDYDDAIFHNYDVSPNPVVRLLLAGKIKSVVANAYLVVAGNQYLEEKAISYGAKRVVVVPTVVDIDKYEIRGKKDEDGVFTIGWIGSPITFKYLLRLKPVFEALGEQYTFRVVYIGSNATLGLENESIVRWTEEDEIEQIKRFDVGIMPLEDNIWERGKCGYKLIQYMACALPVIGTPIGVNARLIVDGHNGFQATSLTEWTSAFSKLLENSPEANERLGLNGRAMVEEHYSLQSFRFTWLEILKQRS